jgi:hypothetical protein
MNKNIQITFMTDPILMSSLGIFRILRWLSAFSYTVKLGWKNLKYGGHPGVTRSVLTGMKELGIEHNYNPIFSFSIHEVVVVMSSVKALRQAIELKKKGKIKLLIAGPNVLDIPTDQDGVLESPAIDFCVVPSNWREKMYHEFSDKMHGRVFSWPSGIDTNFWKPTKSDKSQNIILYLKNRKLDEEFIVKVYNQLNEKFTVDVIEYGKFERSDFKNKLDNAQSLVAITAGSETQGLVWAEAWSMNVPTFVYNHKIDIVQGKKIPSSAAPYIANENGQFFETEQDLINILEEKRIYKPRKWVLEYMSDSASAQSLLNLISRFR